MSKSSSIVARSLLNKHSVSVRFGVLKIKVNQPFIKDLVRAYSNTEHETSIASMADISLEVMSSLIFNNGILRRLFLWYVKRYVPYRDISVATKEIANIVTGKDIFEVVKVDKVKREKVIESVGNNTIAGVIPTIMEHLQLSYMDVWQGVNYPTLLLMMTDKVRSLSGDEKKVVKISGSEMAARRKQNK